MNKVEDPKKNEKLLSIDKVSNFTLYTNGTWKFKYHVKGD